MRKSQSAWILAVLLLASAAAAEAQASRQSWTSDRRAFAVGDVITVLVDEYTLASANRGNFASDSRFRDLGASGSQTVVRSLPSVGASVSTSNEAESRQSGEATRQNRFQGEMTVRVTAVDPSGLLEVEGRKLLNVDDHREELRLTGWIRPQDVSSQNTVDSWRIGDVELNYTSQGNQPKGGLLTRLLGKLWP